MDDLEALLHDLQSAAPLRDSEPKADPRKRADVSSLSYQEWPEPPPPVEPQNAPPPSNGDDFPAPPEPFGADNADSSSLPPPVVPPLPQAYQETVPAPKPGPTSTSANLAELDSLLETLTDTYASELDKAASGLASESAVGTARGGSDGPDAPVSAPVGSSSPESRRTNVKALLSELDSVIDSKDSPVSGAGAGVKETENSASSKIDTSTAAKELDDLMESLSVFKVNAGKKASVTSHPPSVPPPQLKESGGGGGGGDGGQSTTAPYAVPHRGRGAPAAPATAVKPNPAQIDSMLGQLQSNVSEQGIDTTAKGVCPTCKKEIVGQLVTALGATWHPEHFTCASCNAELCRQTFYEREGRAYCEKDYHNLFSPRCAYCNGPVLESCITAMGKTWHPEHFFCHHCSRPFGADVFHEKDGQAYCEKDFYALFAPKCGACAKPIMSGFVSAINQQWHGECFVCWACKQPFAGGNFFEFERKPYCEFHYHERRGSLCYGCQKPILGRCITAMQRKFHPEHFVCAFCLKQLNKGTFKENNEKPYCHACHIKLFG